MLITQKIYEYIIYLAKNYSSLIILLYSSVLRILSCTNSPKNSYYLINSRHLPLQLHSRELHQPSVVYSSFVNCFLHPLKLYSTVVVPLLFNSVIKTRQQYFVCHRRRRPKWAMHLTLERFHRGPWAVTQVGYIDRERERD